MIYGLIQKILLKPSQQVATKQLGQTTEEGQANMPTVRMWV